MKRRFGIVLILAGLMMLTACGEQEGLQDGYYTAQAADFNFGWKEYITIMVKGGNIVSVEYNAENASGFIKSWDNAYMQTMLHSNGTYPNEYTGATSSYESFQKLEAAVIEQAKQGNSSIVYVDTTH